MPYKLSIYKKETVDDVKSKCIQNYDYKEKILVISGH
jgi:hypothetical protein